MHSQSLYQTHLNAVSRSFAFCIAELKAPLQQWIGLAYILCRAIDTIEDAAWPSREKQLESFEQFRKFVLKPPSLDEIRLWQKGLPDTLNAGERDLATDIAPFLSDLHALDEAPHAAVSKTLLSMISGMEHFCRQNSSLRLEVRSISEAHQYCFFVAGIIGELLTELLSFANPAFKPTHEMLIDGVHFGLFLQKVNILKDQLVDEKQGRHFVSSRDQLFHSLTLDAERALAYLQRIPLENQDYRIFCGWSLYLGLASLPWIERAWQQKTAIKISRFETQMLLARVRFHINNNAKLGEIFREMAVAESPARRAQSGVIPSWIERAYLGAVRVSDMRTLGLADERLSC